MDRNLQKKEATAPSDAQIAYVLAGFVKNVRSLSIQSLCAQIGSMPSIT